MDRGCSPTTHAGWRRRLTRESTPLSPTRQKRPGRSRRDTVAEEQMGRSRPPGETSGSPQRPAQRLAEALLTVDLGAELEQLRKEEAWQHGDHNAKTLVKAPDFRIVLIAVKSGGRLKEHYASARLAIQTISGRLRLHLPD